MCTLILLDRVVPGVPVVVAANRDEFRDRIVKAIDMASIGYDKKDWDRIQAIK